MDWDWQKVNQDKQKDEFYSWLQSWYVFHTERPKNIFIQFIKNSDTSDENINDEYLEPGNRITVTITPFINKSSFQLVLIDEELVGIYPDLVNAEFDTLKPLFNIPTNEDVICLIVSMYILNYDWINKIHISKWFFYSHDNVKESQTPIMTLSELLSGWSEIQNFYWIIPYRFHVIQDLMLSTLIPIKKDASYNTIPPNWFKYIPNRLKTPIVRSDAAELLLKAWQMAEKRLIEEPGIVHGNKKKNLIVKQLIEKIEKDEKARMDREIESLKIKFPEQYHDIVQMVKGGESLHVIDTILTQRISIPTKNITINTIANEEEKIILLSGYRHIKAHIKDQNS